MRVKWILVKSSVVSYYKYLSIKYVLRIFLNRLMKVIFGHKKEEEQDGENSIITGFIVCAIYQILGVSGLVVSVLVTGPTGYSVAGSNPTDDGGFLWVIKIPSAHFLRRGSKAVGPMS
jgi:hypothetical protein